MRANPSTCGVLTSVGTQSVSGLWCTFEPRAGGEVTIFGFYNNKQPNKKTPPSALLLPSTSIPLPPPPRPFAPRPSHIILPPFPPTSFSPLSISIISPSQHSFFRYLNNTSLHSLLLRTRESGSSPILLDMGLHCVSVCVFIFPLPRPLGS